LILDSPIHSHQISVSSLPLWFKLTLSVLCACALTLSACGDDDGRGRSSGTFLALTYNVAGLPEGLSGSHPSRFTQIISPRLNAYDLVLVQESWQEPVPYPPELFGAHLYHQILAAGADHPYKSEPQPLPLNRDPERPSAIVSDGLNHFSRFPFGPVMRQRWVECDNSAADCLSLKGFSATRMSFAAGVEIDVYNLHMEAGGTPNDDRLRRDDVTALAAFIGAYSDGRAVIVGGDFNLHIEEELDGATFALLLSQAGLADACTFLACPEPERIDKFLFRSNDTVEITPLMWGNEDLKFRSDAGEQLSDHEPVAVEFQWVEP
jgi:endonuclease/exonuclease/phosphatase family metal-dependent hydrolase